MSRNNLEQVAMDALNQISKAYDAPSMGYDDGTDFEDVIVNKLAKQSGFSAKAIRKAMNSIMNDANEEALRQEGF